MIWNNYNYTDIGISISYRLMCVDIACSLRKCQTNFAIPLDSVFSLFCWLQNESSQNRPFRLSSEGFVCWRKNIESRTVVNLAADYSRKHRRCTADSRKIMSLRLLMWVEKKKRPRREVLMEESIPITSKTPCESTFRCSSIPLKKIGVNSVLMRKSDDVMKGETIVCCFFVVSLFAKRNEKLKLDATLHARAERRTCLCLW